MEAIRVNRQGAQGDVLFTRCDRVPAKLKARECKGAIVVAHSETGHHHVVESPGAELFEVPDDPFTCYLQLAGDAEVKHLRPHDTHQTMVLGAGCWEVRRQREWTPEGYRMVQD